jgi:hypothetical protein
VDRNGNFTLGYIVLTDVQAPMGAWEHFIDASTGKILTRIDTSLERVPGQKRVMPEAYSGKPLDRIQAIRELTARMTKKVRASADVPEQTNGRGLVFDPDPRTSLMNAELMDESEPSIFDQAYVERDLRDIGLVNGNYVLKGPWVTISDFEEPTTQPSISSTGVWTAKRGSDEFDDAMTYFHLDQNQRYIQSLGFQGEKGIQFNSIEVDSNGLNGADNSHYIPSSNRMAFGHGCVDDNEDADVILHEYGHAINYSINRNWSGGDTGAMGEGFGDYWAGSYSASTVNGLSFEKDRVFNWDGSPCWSGRTLNAEGAIYNPATTYSAHTSIEGGFQSDELWSTPLFQSLVQLISLGVPRSEVDAIILEAQFGLGAGVKMRDMATAIVATADRLYPGGQHRQVLLQEFQRHNIIDPATGNP